MKIEIDNSFNRDAKKLPDSILDELNLIYSVKKMEGSKKLKAFRLRLSENSNYRIGFYLEGDTVVLSRILNRKDIYKKFPPKR
ncbi:type II toxin-antitoxin system RelE family toxin [Spirosoma areae]